jgi:hypothetical protein
MDKLTRVVMWLNYVFMSLNVFFVAYFAMEKREFAVANFISFCIGLAGALAGAYAFHIPIFRRKDNV